MPPHPYPDDEIRFLDIRGLRMRVGLRTRSNDRPPLLLCNGLGVRIEGLQPFVDALDPERGLIRFDAPGIGESDATTLPYRMCHVARRILEVLDTLDVGQFDVLGVSWGGALAQQLAFQARARCRRVVLVSTAFGTPTIPGRPEVIREMLSRSRFEDPDHARSVAGMLYGGKTREGGNLGSETLFEHMHNTRRGFVYQQMALLGWSGLLRARRIQQPTLILTGDDDPIIPTVNGKFMKAALPNAELHIFHDGHLGLVTSAGELAERIEEFLGRP